MWRRLRNQWFLFCAFRGVNCGSNQAQCAWSTAPRTINRGGCKGRLDETLFNEGLIGRRNDTIAPFSIRHHWRAPAVAAYHLFGSDGSSIKKVVLKFGERWLNERGDQGSASNKEREHKKHLALASLTGKENFLEKESGPTSCWLRSRPMDYARPW